MRDAVKAMLETAQSLDGIKVVLRRGYNETRRVPALVGETITSIDDGAGALIEARSRDFIIFKDDYRIGGAATAPEIDDYILDSSSGEELIYQVLPFFGDENRRWSDPFGSAWRIHTKLTDSIRLLITLDDDELTLDNAVITMDQY